MLSFFSVYCFKFHLVLNYQFLNTASTVSVVEGENITLVSGLNPKVPTGDRSLEILQIISESGSAVGMSTIITIIFYTTTKCFVNFKKPMSG